MERDPFAKSTENPQFNPENIFVFGKFLSEAREALKKSIPQIAKEIGFDSKVIKKWEAYKGDIAFPEEDILSRIAEHYKVDLNELISKWQISKQAREREKELNKEFKKGPKPRI